MMKDILLTDGFDLLIRDGDIVIGESTVQHQDLLLIAQKGSFKQSPDIGVGIENFLMDEDFEGMCKRINGEFVKDGQKCDSVKYDSVTGEITYNAKYSD